MRRAAAVAPRRTCSRSGEAAARPLATCQPRWPTGNVIGPLGGGAGTSSGARVTGSNSNSTTAPAGLVWPAGVIRTPGGEALERRLGQPVVLAELLEPGTGERLGGRVLARLGRPDVDRAEPHDRAGGDGCAVDVVEPQLQRGDALADRQRAERVGQHPGRRGPGERDERLAADGHARRPARRVGQRGAHERRSVHRRGDRQRTLRAPRRLELDGLVPPQDGERRRPGRVPQLVGGALHRHLQLDRHQRVAAPLHPHVPAEIDDEASRRRRRWRRSASAPSM